MIKFPIKLFFWIVKIKFIYLTKKNKNKLFLGNKINFWGLPILSFTHKSSVYIGNKVTFRSNSKWNSLGINHPCILSTLSSDAEIIIGDEVGMSGVSICAMKKICVGNKTLIGANVKIMDTDFHPIASTNRLYEKISMSDCAEVNIGSNVFIGANSLILKGVKIGDNSVIGAGSIVIKSIPENVIAAGNPCKIIRSLNE